MFPLEVAMLLDAEEAPTGGGGSLPDLPRVPSTCSTAAYQEAYAMAGAAGSGGAKLVLGSAPAAPIAIGRGILHNSVTKINRKNSQVCFRDECEVDSPLLPQRQHHANQPPGEPKRRQPRERTCSDSLFNMYIWDIALIGDSRRVIDVDMCCATFN